MANVKVNVKIATKGKNWIDAEGENLEFITRSAACNFAYNLSTLLKKEVRLDFSDFSGKCKGNGVYIYHTHAERQNLLY